MSAAACVECEAKVEVSTDTFAGEIVECPECGVELEVVKTDPVQLQMAPEIDEDWGE